MNVPLPRGSSAGSLQPRPGDVLLVIDMQRDHLPGGSLAVPGGDAIVGPVGRCVELFRRRGLPVFASRDWHPHQHCSFFGQGGPWPPHCIAGTPGAGFAPGLALDGADLVSKSTATDHDAYSAFDGTDLQRRLRARGAARLYVTGLATDGGVHATVIDALRLGYEVVVLRDAVGALDPAGGAHALEMMDAAGARITETSVLPGGLA